MEPVALTTMFGWSRSLCVFKHKQVLHLFHTVNQVIRKISKTFFIRYLGYFCSQSAKVRFFFNQECSTSCFCSGAGSFQSGSAAVDDNYVTGAFYPFFCIILSGINARVDGTADRTVDTDAVAGAADVAGNTS